MAGLEQRKVRTELRTAMIGLAVEPVAAVMADRTEQARPACVGIGRTLVASRKQHGINPKALHDLMQLHGLLFNPPGHWPIHEALHAVTVIRKVNASKS
ncbi:MAG TPA: hypothetical protein VFV47_00170 [Hyphomicrobiaceae bacterium]|nr:hypothetical protein [Hyphomicrobiaceae bacterium]